MFYKIFLTFTGLFLAGCMDIEQEIWVHDDASATLEYRVGLHQRSDNAVCDDIFQDRRQLEIIEGVTGLEQGIRTEAGITFCDTRVEVANYRQLMLVHERLLGLAHGQYASLAGRYLTEFSLTPGKDAEVSFRQHVKNRAGDEQNKSRLDIQFQGLADLVVGQAMTGRYWTITLHAPQILDSNGTVDKEKQKVIWRIPLYDLMSDLDYAYDMQARFEAEQTWYQKLWKWVT